MLTFGTDGVRGLANRDLTPEYALALGRVAARHLAMGNEGRRSLLVGRDTRASGPLIEAAFSAGVASEGVDVVVVGVCPTPCVAWASATQALPAAMISASHNAFPDNGIKLFGTGGLKLSDAAQARIEADLHALLGGASVAGPPAPIGAAVGRLLDGSALLNGYAEAVVASIDGRRLDGLRVVVDCANGSAWTVAPRVLSDLGAEVQALAVEPDGTNINDGCGSTHLGTLQAAVVSSGADLGLAFDGDADRVLAVDHRGAVVDGDELIAMCAIDLHERQALPDGTVVVTVMANQGFRLGMRRAGIRVEETAVGDRYVLEALEAGGWALGGEQSGHVIFRRLATTGDGLLTAVQLLDLLQRRQRNLAELAAAAMTRLPQVLRNVRLSRRADEVAGVLAAVAHKVAAAERQLGDEGRVLIRASGTEPVIRVMVEAVDAVAADTIAGELVAAVERAAG